jgi:hypothetical protein
MKAVANHQMARARSLSALGMRMLAVLVLFTSGVHAVSAQVGHPPRSSPYRDIRKGHTFTGLGGYF